MKFSLQSSSRLDRDRCFGLGHVIIVTSLPVVAIDSRAAVNSDDDDDDDVTDDVRADDVIVRAVGTAADPAPASIMDIPRGIELADPGGPRSLAR